MNLISVIIPNYNHSAFLKQRIDSVLHQTFDDLEVILLDDSSTDKSRDVIEQYRPHPKVSHIIYNESNSGSTFKQWEKGIEHAKGNFIWIAESDDYCENNFLETIMNGLIPNPNCAVGYAQSYVIDNNNNILWHSHYHKLTDVVNGKQFIKENLLHKNGIFNASMAVFRKSAFNHLSNEFSSFKFCGDWLFWIELINQADVFISGKLLNYFRKHPDDVSNKAYETGYNYFEEVRLLDIIKSGSLITPGEYESIMMYKYNSFKQNKHKILKERHKEIESLFAQTKSSIGNRIKRKLNRLV